MRVWLAIAVVETIIELGKLVERAQNSPGNQMRVRSFAAIIFLQMLVDDATVLIQQLHGDAPLRRSSGNREAGLHVLNDLKRGPANRNGFGRCDFLGLSSFLGWRRLRRRGGRLSFRRPHTNSRFVSIAG